jgi:hypothetical protein
MIVKVQLPIATNEEAPHMLIYTQDRRLEFMRPVTEAMATALTKFPHRGYFRMTFNSNRGDWEIRDRVEDQGW